MNKARVKITDEMVHAALVEALMCETECVEMSIEERASYIQSEVSDDYAVSTMRRVLRAAATAGGY